MTKNILNTLGVLTIGALAICSLSAQIRPVATANIPVDFVVASHEMPAGNYTMSFDHLGTYILLRGEGKGDASFAMTNAAESREPSPQSKLVFKRYGDQYFLSQIWSAGNSEGRELHVSETEREAAMKQAKPTIVSLVIATPNSSAH